MFLNTYSDMDGYRATFNIDQILNGLIKLPNLFVSPSMGVLWSTPIVFLVFVYIFTRKINIDNFYYSFFCRQYFTLLIWQGREVAYGQRLLIGTFLCVFCYTKNLQKFQLEIINLSSIFITWILIFLFFRKLTLEELPLGNRSGVRGNKLLCRSY